MVVQWLRVRLPMHGMWVQSLVGELRPYFLRGNEAHAPPLDQPLNYKRSSPAATKSSCTPPKTQHSQITAQELGGAKGTGGEEPVREGLEGRWEAQ